MAIVADGCIGVVGSIDLTSVATFPVFLLFGGSTLCSRESIAMCYVLTYKLTPHEVLIMKFHSTSCAAFTLLPLRILPHVC